MMGRMDKGDLGLTDDLQGYLRAKQMLVEERLGQILDGATDCPAALIQAILQPGDAHSLRWVFVSDDGSPPSDSSHTVVQTRHDPQRPWRIRAWRRLVDASPACLSIPPLAATLFGPTPQSRAGATPLCQPLQTPSDGLTRGFQAAGGKWIVYVPKVQVLA